MQKRNKIMMATVAILLSLVLITTSIVSTTFAKYVSQKRVDGSFDIDAFGVTVGMELSDEFKAAINSDYAGQTDDKSITLTLNSMKLKPGDSYLDAVKLSVSGTPSVDVRVIIDIDMIIDPNQFFIDKDDFGLDADTNICPIGFKYRLYNASNNYEQIEPLLPFNEDASHTRGIEATLIDSMGNNLTDCGGRAVTNDDSYIYKEFTAGTPIAFTKSGSTLGNINKFGFTFYWPAEYGDDNDEIKLYDAISTWLVQHNDPVINITYTITVEQILS